MNMQTAHAAYIKTCRKRQKDIARLLADGAPVATIAKKYGISRQRVHVLANKAEKAKTVKDKTQSSIAKGK